MILLTMAIHNTLYYNPPARPTTHPSSTNTPFHWYLKVLHSHPRALRAGRRVQSQEDRLAGYAEYWAEIAIAIFAPDTYLQVAVAGCVCRLQWILHLRLHMHLHLHLSLHLRLHLRVHLHLQLHLHLHLHLHFQGRTDRQARQKATRGGMNWCTDSKGGVVVVEEHATNIVIIHICNTGTNTTTTTNITTLFLLLLLLLQLLLIILLQCTAITTTIAATLTTNTTNISENKPKYATMNTIYCIVS